MSLRNFFSGVYFSISFEAKFPLGPTTCFHRQKSGYGLRGTLKIQNQGRFVGFIFEPFIRYWGIEDSELVPQMEGGVPTGLYIVEPKNNSTELGFKLALIF